MDDISKIIVFGGTGNTGLAILDTAIKEGFKVTAFVRNPSKLPKDIRDKVKIIIGDATDKKAVEDALEGQDAVLSSLGYGWNIMHFKPVTLLSNGCINIVSGMRKHDIKRIGVVSTSFNLENSWKPFFMKALITDHQNQIDYLKQQDDIEWFAMNPPQILTKKAVRDYVVVKNKLPGSSWATTGHEIADFMVKCISNKASMDHFKHSLIGISSHKAWFSNATSKILVVTSFVAICGSFVWLFASPDLIQYSSEQISSFSTNTMEYLNSMYRD